VIVRDLDVDRAGGTTGPLKANPPLIVDTDAVLPFAVAAQSLKPVSWQCGEILQAGGSLQAIEPLLRLPCEAGKRLDALALGEAPCPRIPVAHDHCPTM
jgi:hypothetical protein